MEVKAIMRKYFKLIFLSFSFSVISCNAPNEDVDAPPKIQTEFKVDDEVKIEIEPISASAIVKGAITSKGFENVTFGMTEAETRAAFKGHLIKDDDADNPDCYYLSENNGNISLMIYFGTLQRIDVYSSPDIVTKEGATIGMDFGTIEKLYPNTYRKPNFYTYPDKDLIVQLDENIKIIFEQSANEITRHFRIGTLPSINFVEGCF